MSQRSVNTTRLTSERKSSNDFPCRGIGWDCGCVQADGAGVWYRGIPVVGTESI